MEKKMSDKYQSIDPGEEDLDYEFTQEELEEILDQIESELEGDEEVPE